MAALAKQPAITETLKDACEGGLKSILDAMRFSTDPVVASFLEKYDSLPQCDRERLPWEAISLAAQVDATHLLGSIIIAVKQHSAKKVSLMVMTHHPSVMKKRIEFAQTPGGYKDRDAIDTITGALPQRGPTFVNNIKVGKQIGGPNVFDGDRDEDEAPQKAIPATTTPVVEETEGDLDYVFPNLSETQESLIPRSARQLESERK